MHCLVFAMADKGGGLAEPDGRVSELNDEALEGASPKSPTAVSLFSPTSLMGGVLERMERLVTPGPKIEDWSSSQKVTASRTAPLAVAQSVVQDMRMSSRKATHHGFQDAEVPSCRISLRWTVLGFLGLVLASFATLVPTETLVWQRQHDLQDKLMDTMEKQQRQLEDLVHENLTSSSYQCLLDKIGSVIQETVIEPAASAVDSLANIMHAQHALNFSWTGRAPEERRLLATYAYHFLAAGQRVTKGLALEFFEKRAEATMHPYVTTLRVGFASGEYGITQVINEEDTDLSPARFIASEGTENTTLYPIDLGTGELHDDGQQIPLEPVSGWACFTSQANLASMALSGSETRRSWSKIHRYQGSVELGIERAAPLAYCGSYDCWEGVISADISVSHVSNLLKAAFEKVQELLPDAKAETSSIFMVNQGESQSQEGLFLGASNFDIHSLQGVINKASDLPPGNDTEVIRATARAIKLKYHRWDNTTLYRSQLLHFKRSAAGAQDPSYQDCDARKASLARDPDCLVAGTHHIHLDSETSWLLVMVIPAYLLGEEVAVLAAETEAALGDVREAHVFSERGHVILNSLAFAAICATCMTLVMAVLVSRPLKELGNIQELMSKLGDLELEDESKDLKNLRQGKRSRIMEVCSLQDSFCRMMRGVESFARFVPKRVVRDIVKTHVGQEPLLHVRRRNVTIMFSDIADFTTIAESLSEADLLLLLTRYLSVMTEIVEMYSGEVAEILGDGLLIFWNTPEDVEQHAAKACKAALAMQEAIPFLNQALTAIGLPSLSIRIGIHTGPVMSGLIGSARRLKFGCMGDPVNLASRMEGLCKFFGVGVLCSGATLENMPAEDFVCRRMGRVQVKGKSEPTMVFEVMAFAGWRRSTYSSASSAAPSPSLMELKASQNRTQSSSRQSSPRTSTSDSDSDTDLEAGDCDMQMCRCSERSTCICPYCESTRSHNGLTAAAKCKSVNLGAKTLALDFEAALEAFEENRLDEAAQLADVAQAQWPNDGATAQLKRLIARAVKDNDENKPLIPRVIRLDEK